MSSDFGNVPGQPNGLPLGLPGGLPDGLPFGPPGGLSGCAPEGGGGAFPGHVKLCAEVSDRNPFKQKTPASRSLPHPRWGISLRFLGQIAGYR